MSSYLQDVIKYSPEALGGIALVTGLIIVQVVRKLKGKRKQHHLEAEFASMGDGQLFTEDGQPNIDKIKKGIDLAKSYMDCYEEYRGRRTAKKDPGDANRERAWKYIQAGVEIDNTDALRMMGDVYQKGIHTKTMHLDANYALAKDYYTKAMDKNDPIALYEMGLLYYRGMGVEKDREHAKSLLKKSSSLGYDVAKQWFIGRRTLIVIVIIFVIMAIMMFLPTFFIFFL